MSKKQNILVTLMLTLAMLLAGFAADAKKVSIAPNGTIQVVKGDDTVRVSSGALSRLGVNVPDIIDDTLINISEADSAVVASRDWRRSDYDVWQEISWQWVNAAQLITLMVCLTVFALVLLVLLFRYLNRCRKLSIIEKAIECNYPLSDGVLSEGKRTILVQQQPLVMPAAGGTEAAAQQPVSDQAAAPIVGTPVTVNFLSWDVLKSAVKWLAWGIGLLLFGLAEGASPFWCIGFALIVVGAAKAYGRYQEVKSINAQLSRQQASGNQQQQAAAPPQFSPRDDQNQTK